MMKIISNIHDLTIPPLPLGQVDELRKHKLFVNTCLLTAIFAVAYGLLSYAIGFDTGVWTMILSVVFFTICILLLRYMNIKILGFLISLYIIWLNGMLVYYSGGLFTSPVSPWITLTSPVVLLLTDSKTAYLVLTICILYVIAFTLAIQNGYEFPFTYDKDKYQLSFLALSMAGLVGIFFLITNTFESLKKQALDSLFAKQKELEVEEKRSQSLLLNIFPSEIAEELKNTGKTEARFHNDVTILFADIKNFTSISEGLLPQELVALLDLYFQRIDTIVHKHGLEKIKTIGDAYLAAAGVPMSNSATAKNIIDAALEIQYTNEEFKLLRETENKPYFDFRIGIHTGSAVAGVVGSKKYVYDIWGDAVNTAARMEETSEPGRINISINTHQLVKNHFKFHPRGAISSKNKEPIEMFWVLENNG